MAGPGSIRREDPYPQPTAPQLTLVGGTEVAPREDVSFEDGVIKIEQEDGSVVVNFNGSEDDADDSDFGVNLADKLPDADLDGISSDLLEGIRRDEDSRREWLETRALGISLLGLKLEKPRSDAGSGGAPLEGMSTVRHPLLLEATVAFQATARGELLPAAGPVKVRNDTPVPPFSVMQTNAQRDLEESLQSKNDLAQALEKDFNHYLTAIATEYVPDTDRMLFYIGFGGDGFKKVYNCPLRRRPVSESIDAEDLIVSNASVDLQNCGRITHRIKMRKAVLRRMQILGVYRDIELSPPSIQDTNVVDRKKEEISGYRAIDQRPEDRDYDIYECYCELDIDRFAPKKFKGKGLPLPYRVTLEKESGKILDVRRNWDEDDEECMAKRFFVQFPFVRGLGFYGLGYVHLLGNTTNALTGAWRMTLDAGMFANFPAFIYSKGLGRQNTNTFRASPGSGIALDVGTAGRIQDAVMPLPYKEVGTGFSSFMTHVEELGQRLASTANIAVGEGKQDAPVGTTLALIEQSSKVIDSAHKRLHASQAEEFKLLKERFKEDPESFWRHNKRPTIQWRKDQFIDALNQSELVPVADPNNPTSLHRIAKAMAIKTLQQGAPDLYDPVAVDMRIMRIVDIDPQGLFRAQPAEQPPDPRLEAIKAKASYEEGRNQIALATAQLKDKQAQLQIIEKRADRASREKIEALKLEIQKLELIQAQVIHAHDAERQAVEMAQTLAIKRQEAQGNMQAKQMEQAQNMYHDAVRQRQQLYGDALKTAAELRKDNDKHGIKLQLEHQKHQTQMERDREAHGMKMEQSKELHQHKVEAAKQMAKAKPKKEKSSGKAKS